jgi:hypothetical protein
MAVTTAGTLAQGHALQYSGIWYWLTTVDHK